MEFETKKLKLLLSLLILLTLTITIMEELFCIPVSADHSHNSQFLFGISVPTYHPYTSHSSIILDIPGDYVLVNAKKYHQNVPDVDGNLIATNPSDHILVKGEGEYNIRMENVSIDSSDFEYSCPLEIAKNADVNLTLIGNNILKSSEKIAGIDINGSLTITKNSIGTLNLSGSSYGIVGEKLTINGGKIFAYNLLYGIDANNVIVNRGEITAIGSECGIRGNQIIINNGKIESYCGFIGDQIIESNGTITASCRPGRYSGPKGYAIKGNNIIINNGTVFTYGGSGCGVCADHSIIINNGWVGAEGYMYGMCVAENEHIKINGGGIRVIGNTYGIFGGIIDIGGGIVKITDHHGRSLDNASIHSQSTNIIAGIVNDVLYGF